MLNWCEMWRFEPARRNNDDKTPSPKKFEGRGLNWSVMSRLLSNKALALGGEDGSTTPQQENREKNNQDEHQHQDAAAWSGGGKRDAKPAQKRTDKYVQNKRQHEVDRRDNSQQNRRPCADKKQKNADDIKQYGYAAD